LQRSGLCQPLQSFQRRRWRAEDGLSSKSQHDKMGPEEENDGLPRRLRSAPVSVASWGRVRPAFSLLATANFSNMCRSDPILTSDS
jgi:hypothetical protein